MDELYDELPADLAVALPKVAELEWHCLECKTVVRRNELWSFMAYKANKQWAWWVDLDRRSRQIVAFHLGDRSAISVLELLQAIPENYRQKAKVYSNDWEAYKKLFLQHNTSSVSRKKIQCSLCQSHRAVLLHTAPVGGSIGQTQPFLLQKAATTH